MVRSLDWDLAVVSAQRSWAEVKESNFWPRSSGDVSASKLTPIVGKSQFLIGPHPCWLVVREGSQLHPIAQQSGVLCHVVPSILEPTVIHQIILQTQISDHSFCDSQRKLSILRGSCGAFSSGPVVKTLPSSARDVGLIPGWGAKIWHASGLQLGPSAAK